METRTLYVTDAGFSKKDTRIPRDNPIARFKKLFQKACAHEVCQPDAMALATADKKGRVTVRFVLLKAVDERGFVFYTDLRSQKGRQLKVNPYAAAVFYWQKLGIQIRIEGPVETVSDEEADQYWRTRPRQSRIGATISRQSSSLSSRELLLEKFHNASASFKGKEIPRPRYWTGVRIVPKRIEFWFRRSHRLHHRELFEKTTISGKWRKKLLYP